MSLTQATVVNGHTIHQISETEYTGVNQKAHTDFRITKYGKEFELEVFDLDIRDNDRAKQFTGIFYSLEEAVEKAMA